VRTAVPPHFGDLSTYLSADRRLKTLSGCQYVGSRPQPLSHFSTSAKYRRFALVEPGNGITSSPLDSQPVGPYLHKLTSSPTDLMLIELEKSDRSDLSCKHLLRVFRYRSLIFITMLCQLLQASACWVCLLS
jgi:hypothetical protein